VRLGWGVTDRKRVRCLCFGAAFANLGVRIFVVVSGYLITTLLLKDKAATSGAAYFAAGKSGAVCGPAVTDYNLR
jgi:peptidoglycan/LPS O-acetylase OafA/YrhL